MNNIKSIQINDHSTGPNLYMSLQNIIGDQTRVECSIVVFPNHISIRPKSGLYSDYVLARSAIRGMVSKPVYRDEDNREPSTQNTVSGQKSLPVSEPKL